MAIECPGCGRHYDVTLFQFGRTIHCTCGARVSREVQERPLARDPRLRFLCDAMLGRLARWLRALGYDAAFDPEIADAELARRAVEEGRILVTADREFPEEWRLEGCVLLRTEDPLDRLAELLRRLELDPPRALFRRCLECNVPLEPAPAEAVEAGVPERVREREEAFRRCPSCGKVFWEGSHTRRMRRKLARALGSPPEPEADPEP